MCVQYICLIFSHVLRSGLGKSSKAISWNYRFYITMMRSVGRTSVSYFLWRYTSSFDSRHQYNHEAINRSFHLFISSFSFILCIFLLFIYYFGVFYLSFKNKTKNFLRHRLQSAVYFILTMFLLGAPHKKWRDISRSDNIFYNSLFILYILEREQKKIILIDFLIFRDFKIKYFFCLASIQDSGGGVA